jgi:hypothetical protein
MEIPTLASNQLDIDCNLAQQTATVYLDSLIHFINGVTSNRGKTLSKRKDGMTGQDAIKIFD